MYYYRMQSEGNQRAIRGPIAHHTSLRERRDGWTFRSDGERIEHRSVPDEGSHQSPSEVISCALGRNPSQGCAPLVRPNP